MYDQLLVELIHILRRCPNFPALSLTVIRVHGKVAMRRFEGDLPETSAQAVVSKPIAAIAALVGPIIETSIHEFSLTA
jgi:hypothetical protein